MAILHYPDNRPGISRRRQGRGFSYFAPDGSKIDCRKERRRLAAIAVPPAYSNVWMSPKPNGHLQATGRDARGRKQYRYHPEWQAHRNAKKFASLPEAAEALPTLRRWITRNLSGDPYARSTMVAAVLALIDRCAMRPGHSEYTKQNGSFGATTLLPRHLDVQADLIRLDYTAKGGKKVEKSVRGASLARVLERCADLPGPELFTYATERGTFAPVRTEHLIEVLDQLCGQSVTPKTLRTWSGTMAAFEEAHRRAVDGRVTPTAMAEAAARRLHNTAAIARSSYIHPQVLALSDLEGKTLRETAQEWDWSPRALFRAGEQALLTFLREN